MCPPNRILWVVGTTGKGPTVFVRTPKYGEAGNYLSREKADAAMRRSRNTPDLNRSIGIEGQRKYLEDDFTQGKGLNARETMKRNFKKCDRKAIRKALGQDSPGGEE